MRHVPYARKGSLVLLPLFFLSQRLEQKESTDSSSFSFSGSMSALRATRKTTLTSPCGIQVFEKNTNYLPNSDAASLLRLPNIPPSKGKIRGSFPSDLANPCLLAWIKIPCSQTWDFLLGGRATGTRVFRSGPSTSYLTLKPLCHSVYHLWGSK
jgi:hypothetical protein